ncbi:GNAT family N-acetyltransferase [Desertibacillus haloalkaliphilus]|uniref:GNAT family N-acetyltransferase n=1 Tax=Desertibacillus haloalkaliphilus TaxID=1328930 RepID=UPI001C274172|nr:GNAT family N-acetyltransferase [Desertibacillus haloalkaliphilus]MBU8906736.1 GNAT family N-acetyltransferase [Desertibacillus haloalkaliphilus]
MERRVRSRPLHPSDIDTVVQFVSQSPQWLTYEWGQSKVEHDEWSSYMDEAVREFGGEWLVWEIDDTCVAVTFHVDEAESNHKPWLGIIIVAPLFRGRGVARAVVDELCFRKKEQLVLFAAVPISAYEWLDFLGHLQFEQYGVQKDLKEREFLILTRSLTTNK